MRIKSTLIERTKSIGTQSQRRLARKVFSGAAQGGLIKMGGTGLAFLFFMFLARLLSPEQYGIFAVGFSTAFILATFTSAGQQFSILRFWPAADELYGAAVAWITFTRGLKLISVCCAIVMLAGCLATLFKLHIQTFGRDYWIFFAVAALSSAIAIEEYFSCSLRAQGHIVFALLPRDILWRIIVPIAVYLLGVTSGALAILVAFFLLSTVLIVQWLYLIRSRRNNIDEKKELPIELVHQMKSAKWGLWGISVANSVGQNVATIVIGVILGPVAGGAFFAASKLSGLMAMFLTAVNQVVGPLMSRSWHSGRFNEVWLIYLVSTFISFFGAAFVFVVFLLYGRELLGLFGESYSEAFNILIILSVGQLINTACGPNRALLMMAGFERPLFWLVCSTSLLLPLLLPFAASYFGEESVAVLVSLSMTALNIGAASVLAFFAAQQRRAQSTKMRDRTHD